MRLNPLSACIYPLSVLLSLFSLSLEIPAVNAQAQAQPPRPANPLPVPGRIDIPPSLQPLPEVTPTPTPTPPPLLEPPPSPPPRDRLEQFPINISVQEFRVVSPAWVQQVITDPQTSCQPPIATDPTARVFSQEKINQATQNFLQTARPEKPLMLAELFQAADAIARLYLENRYIISGAYVPALPERCKLPPRDAIVPVVVIGDSVQSDAIRVQFVTRQRVPPTPQAATSSGTTENQPSGEKPSTTQPQPSEATQLQEVPAQRHRLRADYIRSRLALATREPLNQRNVLEALQLLKLNPLIQDIRANLYPGTRPGQSFLDVKVVEARSFGASALLDNGRSPSIGSFRRLFNVTEGNLTGLGDSLSVTYANTSGSHAGDLSYSVPINPRNGTLTLNFGSSASRIVEEPFDILDIRSRSRYLEFSYRQPILQTPTRELALGATFSRQFARATLIDGEIPFPVPGSDFAGNTRITALRLFQDWRSNTETSTLALRSQLSVGLPLFNSTDNEGPPDARFVSWLGQAQWVKLLAPDTLILVRGVLQFADRALPPVEQFGLGGLTTVRGYRQDAILGDSGVLGSAEVRIPILRGQVFNDSAVLQIAPFVDVGTAWNRSGFENPDPRTLAGIGLGLRLQIGSRLSARFDWGVPLVSIDSSRDTWQERGLYFSLLFTPF
jgi:hemolysin activation/secretion protein